MRDGDRDAGRDPVPGSGPEDPLAASRGPERSESVEPAGADAGPPKRSSPDDSAGLSRSLMRLSSAGLEFAAAVLLLGGIGYWIDSLREHATPYLGVAGALLGFVVGMYRLIRIAQDVGGR